MSNYIQCSRQKLLRERANVSGRDSGDTKLSITSSKDDCQGKSTVLNHTYLLERDPPLPLSSHPTSSMPRFFERSVPSMMFVSTHSTSSSAPERSSSRSILHSTACTHHESAMRIKKKPFGPACSRTDHEWSPSGITRLSGHPTSGERHFGLHSNPPAAPRSGKHVNLGDEGDSFQLSGSPHPPGYFVGSGSGTETL